MNADSSSSPAERANREHVRIRQGIIDVREQLRRAPSGLDSAEGDEWLAGIEKVVGHLREAVERHFHDEECSGLFEEFQRQYPRASDRLARLKLQHSTILGELNDLLTALVRCEGKAHPDATEIVEQGMHALGELARHEEEETDILQRLPSEDIGIGD
ncbi:MAG: hypothetical protein CME06_09485 [Gemmatimonadetes bacterium]|nr:hypothetical protein [Gemmatimonadota bacterium]